MRDVTCPARVAAKAGEKFGAAHETDRRDACSVLCPGVHAEPNL